MPIKGLAEFGGLIFVRIKGMNGSSRGTWWRHRRMAMRWVRAAVITKQPDRSCWFFSHNRQHLIGHALGQAALGEGQPMTMEPG